MASFEATRAAGSAGNGGGVPATGLMGPGQQLFGDGPKVGLFQGSGKGRQVFLGLKGVVPGDGAGVVQGPALVDEAPEFRGQLRGQILGDGCQTLPVRGRGLGQGCLLYTSPSPRDGLLSRM